MNKLRPKLINYQFNTTLWTMTCKLIQIQTDISDPLAAIRKNARCIVCAGAILNGSIFDKMLPVDDNDAVCIIGPCAKNGRALPKFTTKFAK